MTNDLLSSRTHHVTLHTDRGRILRFGGSCSCGATISGLTSAGMVSAWADDHQRQR